MDRFTVGAKYSSLLDPAGSKSGRRVLWAIKNSPQWKKDLWSHKAVIATKKRLAPISKQITRQRAEREEAEENAAETIRIAVTAIEHALAALQDVRCPTQYEKKLWPASVHNAIYALKYKCGVKFPPQERDPYSKKKSLDRVHIPEGGYIPTWEREKA